MKLRKIKSKFVGLDIGEGSVKMVVVSFASTGPHLLDYAIKEVPKEKGREGLAETIKNVFSEKKLDGTNVICLFSGLRIFIRRIHIPHMKKEELVEAAKWEAKEHIPFPMDKTNLDFFVYGEVEEGGVKKIDGIVAGAENLELEKKFAFLSQAGIKPRAVDIWPFALWNGTRGMELKEKVVSIIDVAEKESYLYIFREGKLELGRNIPGGKDSFVESLIGETISDEGKIVVDNTEALKITQEYGLVQDDAKGMAHNKIPLSKIGVLMRPIAENLLTEIGRFFDHYRETHSGDKIERIILSGEGTRLKNLSAFLSENLAIPVEIANPLKGLEIASPLSRNDIREDSPRLTAAIGLALGKGKGINLLPKAIKIEKREAVKRLSMGVVGGAVFLILTIIYLGLFLQQKGYERRLSRLNVEWKALSPQQMGFIKLTQEKKEIIQALSSFQKIAGRKIFWSGVLKEIGNIIPDNAFLQDLFLKGADNIILRGIISEGKRGAQVSLADFMGDLEKSPFFKNVSMVSSEENSKYRNTLNFELNMELE